LGDDFINLGEAIMFTVGKYDALNDNFKVNIKEADNLRIAYENNKISLDRYAEQLGDTLPDLLNAMKEVIALDQEMLKYYSKTLDAA
jgi:hypothetical protein